MSPAKKAATEESASQWLENQLQEARTRLGRLEHRLDEAVHQLQALASGSRKADELLGSLSASATALPAVQEELRQIKDQLSRLQDRQAFLHNRSEELTRQRQAELERERQERSGLVKRADAVEKGVASYENRWQAIEESLHHLEDEVAASRQGQQHLERALQEILTKASRSVEAVTRLEGAAARLANEVEALQKAGDSLVDRLNLAQEVLRRSDERLDLLERRLPLVDELREQHESARFEREQFAQRIAVLEQALVEVKERSGEMGHLLGVLQQRTQQQATQLLALAEEVREHRQQVTEQLRRFLVVTERQKRRQAEALAQEIKELRQSEIQAQDQQ